MIGANVGRPPIAGINAEPQHTAGACRILVSFTGGNLGVLARATVVTGRPAPPSDPVRVLFAPFVVKGDSVLARHDSIGATANPWKQGLGAVGTILSKLIPGSIANVAAEWKNRDLRASRYRAFALVRKDKLATHADPAAAHLHAAIHTGSEVTLARMRLGDL